MDQLTADIIKEISENLLKCTKQYIGQKNNTNTQNAIKETVFNYVCDKPLDKVVIKINMDD